MGRLDELRRRARARNNTRKVKEFARDVYSDVPPEIRSRLDKVAERGKRFGGKVLKTTSERKELGKQMVKKKVVNFLDGTKKGTKRGVRDLVFGSDTRKRRRK